MQDMHDTLRRRLDLKGLSVQSGGMARTFSRIIIVSMAAVPPPIECPARTAAPTQPADRMLDKMRPCQAV
jgi:hypothetical protein